MGNEKTKQLKENVKINDILESKNEDDINILLGSQHKYYNINAYVNRLYSNLFHFVCPLNSCRDYISGARE